MSRMLTAGKFKPQGLPLAGSRLAGPVVPLQPLQPPLPVSGSRGWS